MAWLTSLLKRPAQVEEPVYDGQDLEPSYPLATGPELAVLVPDTAGISSFRITMMPDSFSAAEQIALLRADIRHETHAFWAMHEKPVAEESTHVEALVLIRAEEDTDLVYVVSFLDIESALSFTRFEVRRGLHLGNVMIYWAAFAQLREELDGISITPAFAPLTESYTPQAATFEDIAPPLPSASAAIAEPELRPRPEPVIEPRPAPQPIIQAEPAAEPVIERRPAPAEPVIEPRLAAEPAIEAAPAVEPAPAPDTDAFVELPPEEDPAQIQRAMEEYLRRMDKPRQRMTAPRTERPVSHERPVVSFERQAVQERPAIEPVEEVPVAEPVAQAPVVEPVAQAPVVEPIVERVPAPADDKEHLGPMWPEGTPKATLAAQPVAEPEVSSPVAEEQAAIDEAFVFQHKSIEQRSAHKPSKLETAGAENGMIVEEQPQPLATFGTSDAAVEHMAERMGMSQHQTSLEELAARVMIGGPEPGVETVPGDDEMEFAPLNSVDPATGMTAAPKIDDFDIAYEVERLLRGRRLEQRDGPFSGFQSPPGRF